MLRDLISLATGNALSAREHEEAMDALRTRLQHDVDYWKAEHDAVKKQLDDANARTEHLQAAVDNLRGDLSFSNGARDRLSIKITAAIKALQS